MTGADWEPGARWRVLTSSGAVWCETWDEEHARSQANASGRILQRQHLRIEYRWVPEAKA